MQKILIAPLDWGLGHATRCIPLIDSLLRSGCEVILAGSGLSLQVLKDRFPKLDSFVLPAYAITYSKKGMSPLHLMKQLPRLLKVIWDEHHKLLEVQEALGIDAVISDNRYGLWHPHIPTVIVCHQLQIQLPRSMAWGDSLVQRFHQKLLDKFDACWIPDWETQPNLSGVLSHKPNIKSPVRFIGPLSRFGRIEENIQSGIDYSTVEIAVVLSGPEPQRSILEKILIEQVRSLAHNVIIVQGLPGKRQERQIGNLKLISYLDENELIELYNKARIVVSRSGYSSLMDYASLQIKQLILIPTPGQTEQEYLSQRLNMNKIAYTVNQNDIELKKAIYEVEKFHGFSLNRDFPIPQPLEWLSELAIPNVK